MIYNDIELLSTLIKNKARNAIDKMNKDEALQILGVDKIAISETKREKLTQVAYWCRGRMSDYKDIQAVYREVIGWIPSEKECMQKITWTLKSKHIEGLAIDLVPVKDGKLWWTAPISVWERMGEIGEQCGLNWGGRWKTKDCPHFEV